MVGIVKVNFRKLYSDVELPQYATKGSAGFDIRVHHFKSIHGAGTDESIIIGEEYLREKQFILLQPFTRVLVGCGFAISMPEGYELQCRSRSGLALKEGLIVLNAPGTIDSDYRGEIGAIIYNSSRFPIEIKRQDRIAQCVLHRHEAAIFQVVEQLEETNRGAGGYGSTGKQ